MSRAELNYQILLEVTNVLNSQRDTESLWWAITRQIRTVISWDRAGILAVGLGDDPAVDELLDKRRLRGERQ